MHGRNPLRTTQNAEAMRYFDKPAAREAEDAEKTLANKASEHKTSRHKNFGA
jgi:hypothetical protein